MTGSKKLPPLYFLDFICADFPVNLVGTEWTMQLKEQGKTARIEAKSSEERTLNGRKGISAEFYSQTELLLENCW